MYEVLKANLPASIKASYQISSINPYLAHVAILSPLKTVQNLWFSEVFKGYKLGPLARNGLMTVIKAICLMNFKANLIDNQLPVIRVLESRGEIYNVQFEIYNMQFCWKVFPTITILLLNFCLSFLLENYYLQTNRMIMVMFPVPGESLDERVW